MASEELLSFLRQTEAEKRMLDKRGWENRPFSDPAFRLIQANQINGPGNYMLSDVLPRGPSPKVQSISSSALEASSIPYEIKPSVHPAIERLERKLLAAPSTPRVYLRDMTIANEVYTPQQPYDSVIWQSPSPDEAELHFVSEDAIRLTGIDQKLVSTTFLKDYQLPPVIYGISEPVFGNRLLESRDSRRY